MSPRVGILAVALLAIVVGPVAGAGAQSEPRDPSRRTVSDSELLWATVNVCDTEKHPDTIGVRGSMPGARDGREMMWMRFQVQYFSPADGRWHQVRSGGDSGFVRVGRARFEARQSGRSFRFAPRSRSVLLRGVVTFEWRRSGEVVRRARKRTTADHRSSAGADPENHSASNCTIRT
ncbi:MAG: hypothetical protein H0T43_02420 [Solirubrobacterales bacterium]|nr:hypothetical protein [Solirubrobacterales bacterium]